MDKAVEFLTEAIKSDRKGESETALKKYIEGLKYLLEVIKTTTDIYQQEEWKKKFKLYADRAEELKLTLSGRIVGKAMNIISNNESEVNQYPIVIKINNNDSGHNYETIFNRCFDEAFISVDVEDPYICSIYQIRNFVKFCELVILKSSTLKNINLITKKDEKDHFEQNESLKQLQSSLMLLNISMNITFSDTLHDRSIKFSNGFTVHLGRGLDIFKPIYFSDKIARFSIGCYEDRLRKCYETTVTIYKC